MTEIEEAKKVLAETTLRLIRVEHVLDYILTNNPKLNLPTGQEMLNINIKAADEVTMYVPWAVWKSQGE